MKKIFKTMLAIALVGVFAVFALASGESETTDQGKDTAKTTSKEENLGEYNLEIMGCRIAKDFEGKDVVIVKYKFTNNSDDAASFMVAFDDAVYQDGIGLNEAYILDESANYSSDNQTKEIKTGSSLEVEAAYELNDTETDVEVEVKQLFSFDDSVVKKSFSIK